ncbi:MAG: Gx transporter family protein [Spirochaetales bacterium]|nr:Gx transporter family protein [Spirochaetales bacterium]
MKTREIAETGLLITLAMVLSYVESLIPAFVAIPGIKVGLANIVVVYALYRLDFKHAFLISLLRVLLSALLFGTVLTLAYSAAGAFLSLVGMSILKRTGLFGTTAVSVSGAVLHNLGQIAVAAALLGTGALFYYLPFLIISGVVTGVVIGLVSAMLIRRVGKGREDCNGSD